MHERADWAYRQWEAGVFPNDGREDLRTGASPPGYCNDFETSKTYMTITDLP